MGAQVGKARGQSGVCGGEPSEKLGRKALSGFSLDDSISYLLRRAHQRASSILLVALTRHRLTPRQYFALARLYEVGSVSQNHLGRLAAMDPATTQGVVQRLQRRRLIKSSPAESDRRRHMLQLTPAGLQLIRQLVRDEQTRAGTLLDALDTRQRRQLRSLLSKLA